MAYKISYSQNRSNGITLFLGEYGKQVPLKNLLSDDGWTPNLKECRILGFLEEGTVVYMINPKIFEDEKYYSIRKNNDGNFSLSLKFAGGWIHIELDKIINGEILKEVLPEEIQLYLALL